jgi:F-type H+-transporting ATPase subunit delta
VPHVRVNPEIIGGVIVRYGDRVLDGSLRRRLLSMRRQLLNAELPATKA